MKTIPVIARRDFVRATSALAAGALAGGMTRPATAADAPAAGQAARPLLTPAAQFRDVSRGTPRPHSLTGDEIGRAHV